MLISRFGRIAYRKELRYVFSLYFEVQVQKVIHIEYIFWVLIRGFDVDLRYWILKSYLQFAVMQPAVLNSIVHQRNNQYKISNDILVSECMGTYQ